MTKLLGKTPADAKAVDTASTQVVGAMSEFTELAHDLIVAKRRWWRAFSGRVACFKPRRSN